MTDSRINDRLQRARQSLEGLSVGDALGEQYFVNPAIVESLIASRALPAPLWRFTDDTLMALSIFSVLRQQQKIDPDILARSFAECYDPSRGYGAGMNRMLPMIRQGESWRDLSINLFSGQGSYGNGAAMRVAPLGAYFADDLSMVVEQAALSAMVTHAHEEGLAGAIAVAVAAAFAWQMRGTKPGRKEFLDAILPYVPKSEVSSKIRKARDMEDGASVQFAISVLGNSSSISAQDTAPFCLWCAAQYLNNYEEAIWLTLGGLGDRDTTCAIVGGIVASNTGTEAIPEVWRQSREPLPDWAFEEVFAV